MSEKTNDTLRMMKILELSDVPIEKIRANRERIGWDNIYLFESWLWSSRSHDPQTQCGCVLVRNNTVLSTGYNGFIGDINDEALPNLRPHKYDFMIHAEHNAILNCARNGISTVGATAYITSIPCTNCLQYLWQAGIHRIVHSDINKAHMVQNDKSDRVRQALLDLMNPIYGYPRIRIDFISRADLLADLSKLFPIINGQNTPLGDIV